MIQKYPLPVPLLSCLSEMAFSNSPERIFIFYDWLSFARKYYHNQEGVIATSMTNCLTMKGMQRLLIIYSFRSDC